MKLASLDRGPQHAAGPQQVLLADDLVELARSHPIGEGCRRLRGGARALRLTEQLHP